MHSELPDFAMPEERQVEVAASALRMLADPTRIKILWALMQGETSVNCLAEVVGASPSTVSQHLAKLRLAGLVHVRREGTFMYYAASDSHVQGLLTEALSHADHSQPAPRTGRDHQRVVGSR